MVEIHVDGKQFSFFSFFLLIFIVTPPLPNQSILIWSLMKTIIFLDVYIYIFVLMIIE
jgi:hypothetical protein